MDKSQPKRFSDFARENMPLEGSKLKLDEVVNREITILDYRIKDSRYKKESAPRCLTLQFELEGKRYILFTGSNVLVDQIDKYKAEIPFVTTIKKIDKYYTFS